MLVRASTLSIWRSRPAVAGFSTSLFIRRLLQNVHLLRDDASVGGRQPQKAKKLGDYFWNDHSERRMRRQLERHELCHLPIPNLPVCDRFTSRAAGLQFVQQIRPPLAISTRSSQNWARSRRGGRRCSRHDQSGFHGVGVPFPGLIGDGRELALKPWATTLSLA